MDFSDLFGNLFLSINLIHSFSLSGVLVLIACSWWAGVTMYNSSWVGRAYSANGGGMGGTIGRNFTIGTCVILGWVFSPIVMIASCVGCYMSYNMDEDEMEAEKYGTYPGVNYPPSMHPSAYKDPMLHKSQMSQSHMSPYPYPETLQSAQYPRYVAGGQQRQDRRQSAVHQYPRNPPVGSQIEYI